MDPTTQNLLTLLLGGLAAKDRDDLTRVCPMIYEDLRRMAQRYTWIASAQATRSNPLRS